MVISWAYVLHLNLIKISSLKLSWLPWHNFPHIPLFLSPFKFLFSFFSFFPPPLPPFFPLTYSLNVSVLLVPPWATIMLIVHSLSAWSYSDSYYFNFNLNLDISQIWFSRYIFLRVRSKHAVVCWVFLPRCPKVCEIKEIPNRNHHHLL